jgi:hypothetical protein
MCLLPGLGAILPSSHQSADVQFGNLSLFSLHLLQQHILLQQCVQSLFHGKYRYNAIVGLPFGGSNMGGSAPPLEVATPAVLPQPPQRSDMGHHEAGNLAVFLNSRGEVTAYSATGRKLWQVWVP